MTMDNNQSEFIGVTGSRKNLFIKVTEMKFISSTGVYIYSFTDRRGNVVKSWVQEQKHYDWKLELGDCIDIDAYVNKHELNTYTQIRETYINRIKILENKGKP